MEAWVTIIVAVLSSTVLSNLITFLVTRNDKKKENRDEIRADIDALKKAEKKNEKDNVRLQMLVMMSMFPESTQEILVLAERYFAQMHGNWYMTSLFNTWLEKNQIAKPEWFIQ